MRQNSFLLSQDTFINILDNNADDGIPQEHVKILSFCLHIKNEQYMHMQIGQSWGGNFKRNEKITHTFQTLLTK